MTYALLLAWGTVVGVDLVTWGQVMIARPLVAGTVAGALAGDVTTGAMVGIILELFALDVLPVGAVRYPDYGPAAVVGAATAAHAPDVLGVGVGVALGLAVAYAGEWSIVWVRHRTSRAVRARAAALDAGDAAAIRALHAGGIARDVVRAFTLTGAGLALGALVRNRPPVDLRGAVLLTAAMVGAALATATLGTLRIPERRRALVWFAAGIGLGVLWVVLA